MIKITHKLSLTTIKRQFVIFRIYTSNINQQSLIFSNSYLQRPSMNIFNVLSSGSSQPTENLIECVVRLFIAMPTEFYIFFNMQWITLTYLIDYALSILPDSHLFYFVLQVVMFLFHQQKKRKNEKKHIFIHCCYLNNFTSYSLHIRLSKDSFTPPYEMLLICKMPPFRLPSDILSELVFHTCYAAL